MFTLTASTGVVSVGPWDSNKMPEEGQASGKAALSIVLLELHTCQTALPPLFNVLFTSVNNIFKESALGRFFHRVAMSVYLYIYISVVYMSPFHVIFFAWNKTGSCV